MVLVLGIVKASLEILGIGIGVKKSGIAHVCFVFKGAIGDFHKVRTLPTD